MVCGVPVAIVTASDSGIGKATAVALARDGFDVGITWHSDESGAAELERWRHVLEVDLTGAFVCVQAAARRMVAAGTPGRIVNVTSIHEHVPLPGSSAYCAAELLRHRALARRRRRADAHGRRPGGHCARPRVRP